MVWVGGDKHKATDFLAVPQRNVNLTRGILDTALANLVKDMPAGMTYLTRDVGEGTVMAMQIDPSCAGLEGGASQLVQPEPVRSVVETMGPEGLFVTPVFSTIMLFMDTMVTGKSGKKSEIHMPFVVGMDATLNKFVGVNSGGGPSDLLLVTSGGRADGAGQDALANTVLGTRLNCQTPLAKTIQSWLEARASKLEIGVLDSADQWTGSYGSMRVATFMTTTDSGVIEWLTIGTYAPRASQVTVQFDRDLTRNITSGRKTPVLRGWKHKVTSCSDSSPDAWSCKTKLSWTTNDARDEGTLSFSSNSAICTGSTTAYSHGPSAGFANPAFVYAAMPATNVAAQTKTQTRVKCADATGSSSIPAGMILSSLSNRTEWAKPLAEYDGHQPIKVPAPAYTVQLWELLVTLVIAVLFFVLSWLEWDPVSELCIRHLYSASVPGTCIDDEPPLEYVMELALIELPPNLRVGPFTHHVQLAPVRSAVKRVDSATNLPTVDPTDDASVIAGGQIIATATTYPKMRAEVKRLGLEGKVGGMA
ncbi:hypothetical protein AMAG_13649 [Allomyces macrogynus ATCC 38327]|uniref:Uncharacterized protein n=1 Tax=Allomyces macrogynus (strain ATCC 38327) TaxID=578462 RepID=A0A0L0T3G0_ALLM3|nr:hypothetical protein AMAG_13649 [Allomyces macrogynus ATCC 38327]|eukprot:KNE69267.1 hypothetical protein AMAG_13649 [Allomyces macrogynus ATCC 38327]